MAQRKAKFEPHVRLYQHEHQSKAYQSLSPEARALLFEFRALYQGKENRVFMSVREMMRRVGVGRHRAEHARGELLDRGFIRMVKIGSFSRKQRHATEYILTNEPLDNKPATKEFMRWSKKNTVLMTSTDGADDRHRGPCEAGSKHPHGADDRHREPQNGNGHGADDQHTVRLPPHRGFHRWEPTEMGFRSKRGFLLNTCCLVCGVWITNKGIEFDEARHRCDPVSKEKYRACFGKEEAA